MSITPLCDLDQNGTPELQIVLFDGGHFTPRLQEFGFDPHNPAADDGQAHQRYARASYLRHASYLKQDAAKVAVLADWQTQRARKNECVLLLEAWRSGMIEKPNGLAGVLLLRSAWNGDVAMDYVMSNQKLNATVGIREAGRKLIAAGLKLAADHGAGLLWVETAEDSSKWWKFLEPKSGASLFLNSGEEFIRYRKVSEAQNVVRQYLTSRGTVFHHA